ncbi:hypothetical protein PS681_02052 [Pseudomonas fluorescens]|nr:hypothetical protein PS681_02052 [Pseudomonas fluorescens]
MQTLDDDRVVLVQAGTDDAQAFDFRTQLDGAVYGFVVRIHHQHELLAQVSTDGFVVDQHGVVGAAADQLQACVQARGVGAVAVIEHRATTDGAGFRVDLVVDEVHLAEVRVAVFIGQAHVHRGRGAALTVAGELGVLEEHTLVGVEVGINAVGGYHTGQRGGVGGHQVTGGDLGTADAATDRRGHAGEAEVQFGQVQLRLQGTDGGAGFLSGAGARVGQFGGNGVAGTQTFTTTGFVFTAGGVGAGLGYECFEAAHLSLERTRVDLEQQVAFLDQCALSESDVINLAGDSWTDFNGFRRFEAPGEFVPLVDRLFDHLGHADFCCGHSGGSLRSLAAGAHHQYGQHGQREAQMFE